MIFTILDNEIIYNFDNEFEALLRYIDIISLKFNFLNNLIEKNINLNISDFNKIKMFYTKKSYLIDIIYLDIDEIKFKNFIDNTNFKFTLNEDENLIILKKLNLLKKQKNIVDSFIINKGIFINKTNLDLQNYYDNSSDTISNVTLDLESIKVDSDDSLDLNTNSEIIDINIQKEKLDKLTLLKKEIENNKKKKEKLEEILRQFNVDFEIYNKIKNHENIPELFKYKFEVFKEMDELKIINNLNLAKKYYIKNYNKVNKSIGSSIYTNMFNQTEAEEN